MSESKAQSRPDPVPGGCHFYIDRKRRYCRFKPAKDSQYCAEHATVFGVDLGRKRIKCPYDPKHTCYADKLDHHMKKCPNRPRDMPDYYCAGINSGDDAGEQVPDPKETVSTVPVDELQSIIEKVNRLYDEHVGELQNDVLSHPCLREELENRSYGTAALRHRKQQASIIGQMEKLGLLADGKCFLEMGAGKGQLSHWLHGAVVKCKDIGFVLIDRSQVRNKRENLHKEEMIMERIRIDIEHLRLGKVPSIEANERGVVAFGKHLCGAATDLALRCVTETLTTEDSKSGEETPERKRLKSEHRKLAGSVIALCCHHRCTWKPYVGKHFFRQCGLSARDFQVMSGMSSWAICSWKGWSYQRKLTAQNLKGADNPAEQAGGNEKSEHSTDSGEIHEKQNVTPQENSEGTGDIVKAPGLSIGNSGEPSENSTGELVGDSTDELVEDNTSDMEEEEKHIQDENTTNTGISTKLSQEEREVIGRKCKRLIDYGRVCYLREHGLNSLLKVYIEEFYTPENVVLVASA